MGFFEDLLRKGLEELDDKVLTADQFNDLTSKLGEQLDQLEDGALKSAGRASLDELIARRSDVLHLRKDGLVLFMTHVAGGKTEAAQLEFIRNKASADDLIAGMIEDAGVVARRKQTEDEFMDQALEIVTAIGRVGAQVLLPMLLGAL